LTVNTVAAAAELGGLPWTTRLARAWDRYDRLRTDFPACAELERVLRATDQYTDADFNLLCTAATWFANHNADGLTPRQVPVPGLHAKWLNTSQHLVATLAGRDALGLAAPHPARVHFTYLDPEHLTAGGRRHDCISVGDNAEPAYTPKVVLISENKDTAVVLGPVPGGIAVEGGGFGGATAAALPWISACPVLLYWGDIDPSGYEILNGFRQAGLKVVSILMDQATYYAHEKFGSHTDKNGAPIQPSQRRTLPFLTPDEASMYERLTDPTWTRARRIEQERIPLGAATLAITAAAQLGSPAQ
jgi:hypothetical protein